MGTASCIALLIISEFMVALSQSPQRDVPDFFVCASICFSADARTERVFLLRT